MRILSLLALLLPTLAVAAPPAVTAVAYSPNGSWLAAGTRGVAHLIDPATGAILADLPGQTQRVTAVAVSKAGKLAVASGEPGKSGVVRLYDIADCATDPHFLARKAVQEVTDPLFGRTLHPGPAIRLDGDDPEKVVAWTGPAVGAHNDYVLGELLGRKQA